MSKKRKKVSSRKKQYKPRRSLSAAKLEIAKSSNLKRGISAVKEKLPPHLYSDFIEWVASQRIFRGKAFNPFFPTTPFELEKVGPLLVPSSIEKEFLWAGAYISLHAERLKDFIALSVDFQNALLTDDQALCEELLEKIERDFGYSLWLIKKRTIFTQSFQGLEGQKRYSNQIKEEARELGIVSFIAHYTSYKNEPAVSPGRFADQFERNLEVLDLTEPLKTYIRYHCLPISSELNSIDSIRYVLWYENSRSLIDYYETLIEASISVISSNQHMLFLNQ